MNRFAVSAVVVFLFASIVYAAFPADLSDDIRDQAFMELVSERLGITDDDIAKRSVEIVDRIIDNKTTSKEEWMQQKKAAQQKPND